MDCMPLTLIRGETQIMPGSIDLSRLFSPFLTATEGDWNITNGGNDYTITGIRDPTAAQDAATKAYVDSLTSGFSWTDPARVCAPEDVEIDEELEDGDVIDGITLVTGDRVLLTNQLDIGINARQGINFTEPDPTGGTWVLELHLTGYAQIDVPGLAYNIMAGPLETAIDVACNGVVTGWTNGDISLGGAGGDILSHIHMTYSGDSVSRRPQALPTIDDTNLIGPVTFTAHDHDIGRLPGPDHESGVYIVQESGAALRATDWSVGTSAANFAIFVAEGTWGNKAYVVTNNAPDDVIDSDALIFEQFAGAGQIPPAHNYGDAPTVTNGVAFVTLTNVPITGGTERVYLNGILQVEGGSNDYTIVDSTGVITFTFNLSTQPGQLDIVLVDYDN